MLTKPASVIQSIEWRGLSFPEWRTKKSSSKVVPDGGQVRMFLFLLARELPMICCFDAANIEDVVVERSLKDPCDLVSQSREEVTMLFGKSPGTTRTSES